MNLSKNKTAYIIIYTPPQTIHTQSSNRYQYSLAVDYQTTHPTSTYLTAKKTKHIQGTKKRHKKWIHTTRIHTTKNQTKNRKRNIIWFNPPYSKNVKTDISKDFINLIEKHFPKHSTLAKIFNKNNLKISYKKHGPNYKSPQKKKKKTITTQQKLTTSAIEGTN